MNYQTGGKTMKHYMSNPAAFVGRRVDPNAWHIPDGYALCRKTWKLQREKDLLRTFAHHLFPREFLLQHGIYIEDADWLSNEGYDEIMDVLCRLGLYDAYVEAVWSNTPIQVTQ